MNRRMKAILSAFSNELTSNQEATPKPERMDLRELSLKRSMLASQSNFWQANGVGANPARPSRLCPVEILLERPEKLLRLSRF